MRCALAVLIRIAGIVAACLLAGPAWRKGLFATSALLCCLAVLCTVSLIMAQLELSRRIQRREPSVVRPSDREKLRNRALLDHAPVPLLFRNVDGTLHAANRAARRLFGTEGRLLAPPASLLAVLDDRAAPSGGRMIRLTPSSGGPPRVYAVSVGQGGGVGGIVTYLALTDVEAGLNAAEAQALRDLLQILSHEIMNSLTPIVSLSATAEELFAEPAGEDMGPLIGEALATIRRRAEGLDRFVRGYRDLARLPAPELKPVELGELLRETAKVFDARWAGRVALDLALPPLRAVVRIDRTQMEQALLNLLNNGAEAAMEHSAPHVRLAGEVAGGSASILVCDTGGGIDPARRERIFQPFVSFKPGGNGIGLTLARQIALGHGGTLTLEETKADDRWRTAFRLRL